MILTNFNEKNDKKIVLALGYFDCLHIGHKKLLSTAKQIAKELNVLSAVFTFSNNPGELLNKKNKLINTFKERLSLFEKEGMDMVIHAEFTPSFMNNTADEFLCSLKEKNVVGVVCGFDYTFGKKSEGTTEKLAEFCKNNNIRFCRVDKVDFYGEKASATLIKNLLIDGHIEKANECLGHEYFVTGKVCKGYGIGSKQVFPTANITIPKDKIYPKIGVYSGKVLIKDKYYYGVINVGSRPTFNDDENKIEIFIIDFNDNIYQEEITVYFDKYLREIKKFDSPQELKEQISMDVEATLCVK